MRIGIYARGLSGMGGVKQYIEAMCRALIRQLLPEDRLFILHNLRAPCFATDAANVVEIPMRSRNRLVCDFIEGPREMRRLCLDVAWFTKYVIPFGVTARTVTTVHDLAYFMPALAAYPLGDTIYMRAMIRQSCRRADRIVAVSENTKRDILRYLKVSSEKVAVIHEAADERYRVIGDAERIARFRQRRGLPDRFILFTGGISPRKNLLRLIEAFDRAAPLIPHRLVLTGGKGWRNREVESAIEGRTDIIRLGFVPDDEMPLLYNAADLFVYPSLYEGFGLPILEAARCGCPVVCGQNSALVEVGGAGVRFVDPRDVKAMANEMTTLVSDSAAKRRLVEKGFENEKRFSWDKAATELLALMREMTANPTGDASSASARG